MSSEISLEAHLPIAAQPSVQSRIDYAQTAEEHGYNRVWQSESWGRDSIAILMALAEHTDSIGLGTSITNVYSRSPGQVGMAAATLQEYADGRFRLGLGPSGPAVIKNWHGVAFDQPLRRTREYIDIVRTVVNGEPVNYEGEMFDLHGFRLRSEAPQTPPRIDAAGMGPKMIELAGRFADGWHAMMFTPDGLESHLENLHRGIDLGDRDPDDVRVTLSLPTCVLEDVDRAQDLAYGHAAFYLGAMGTYYRDALANQGHEQIAHDVFDAWQDGDSEQAVSILREEFDIPLVATGTPDEAHEIINQYAAIDGLDAIALNPPRGAEPSDVHETLEALAPQ